MNDASAESHLGGLYYFKTSHSKQQGQGPLTEVFNDWFLTSD